MTTDDQLAQLKLPDLDPAAYLAALDPATQAQLVTLVRAVADTSDAEKELLMIWLDSAVSSVLARMRFQEQAKLVELLSSLGLLLGAVYFSSATEEVA